MQNKRNKLLISNNKKTALKWLILLGLLIMALCFYRDSLQEILEGIKELSAVQISVSLLLSLGFFLTEGFIIYCMVHPFTDSYRWIKGIRTVYLCEFYRIPTLGSGSGFAEIYYLQKDGVAYPTGTGITMLQFVLKKISVMLLGLTGFLYLLKQDATAQILHKYRGAITAGCFITIVIVIVLLSLTLSYTVKNWLLFILNKASLKFPAYHEKTETWKENLELLNHTGRSLLTHRTRFLAAILLSLGKLLLIYLIPAYILIGQCSLSVTEMVMLMSVSYMLAGVIPAPSGIGSLEFVFLLFFSCFAGDAVIVPAILVFRFATWIVPFFIGCIFFLTDKFMRKAA